MTGFYIILFFLVIFCLKLIRNNYLKNEIRKLYGDLVAEYSDCELLTLSYIVHQIKKYHYTSIEVKVFKQMEKTKSKEDFRTFYQELISLVIKKGESYT